MAVIGLLSVRLGVVDVRAARLPQRSMYLCIRTHRRSSNVGLA